MITYPGDETVVKINFCEPTSNSFPRSFSSSFYLTSLIQPSHILLASLTTLPRLRVSSRSLLRELESHKSLFDPAAIFSTLSWLTQFSLVSSKSFSIVSWVSYASLELPLLSRPSHRKLAPLTSLSLTSHVSLDPANAFLPLSRLLWPSYGSSDFLKSFLTLSSLSRFFHVPFKSLSILLFLFST